MANKQDVQNAFYAGVCLILKQWNETGGVNVNEVNVNLSELLLYAILADEYEVAGMLKDAGIEVLHKHGVT